jgi:hypothetical protein
MAANLSSTSGWPTGKKVEFLLKSASNTSGSPTGKKVEFARKGANMSSSAAASSIWCERGVLSASSSSHTENTDWPSEDIIGLLLSPVSTGSGDDDGVLGTALAMTSAIWNMVRAFELAAPPLGVVTSPLLWKRLSFDADMLAWRSEALTAVSNKLSSFCLNSFAMASDKASPSGSHDPETMVN